MQMRTSRPMPHRCALMPSAVLRRPAGALIGARWAGWSCALVAPAIRCPPACLACPLQPHVRAAIEAIRADTSQYERYAADPQILAVLQVRCLSGYPRAHLGWGHQCDCGCWVSRPTAPLAAPARAACPQKMRRLHSVAQANGQRTVSIEDMLAQPGYQQRDAERQLAIEAACAAHLAAAAAAAACEPGSDAKAAAEAAFQAAFQEAKDAAGAGMAGKTGDGAAAAKLAGSGTGSKPSATSLLRQRAGGGTSSARVSAADAAAAGELEKRERARGPEAEDADVPEWMRGEFSWKVGPPALMGPRLHAGGMGCLPGGCTPPEQLPGSCRQRPARLMPPRPLLLLSPLPLLLLPPP